MKWSRGLTLALALPLLVVAGAPLGSALLLGILVIDWRTKWLFDADEEQQLVALAKQLWDKLTQRFLPT